MGTGLEPTVDLCHQPLADDNRRVALVVADRALAGRRLDPVARREPKPAPLAAGGNQCDQCGAHVALDPQIAIAAAVAGRDVDHTQVRTGPQLEPVELGDRGDRAALAAVPTSGGYLISAGRRRVQSTPPP